MTGTGLSDLVAKAFETACDSAGMEDFLTGTAEYFDAQQGTVVISPLHNPSDLLPITYGTTPECMREWLTSPDGPGSILDRFAQLRPGDTVRENGGNLDPNGQSMRMLGSIVSIDERNLCLLVLWRMPDRSPFSEPEGETLSVLSNFLRRAIEVNTRFVEIFTEHKNAISVLDQAPRAVIILGQNGQPTYQNFEAQRITSKNDGLFADKTGIRIEDEVASEKVSAFLKQIHAAEPDQFTTHRLTTVIRRQSNEAPYKLLMYALPFKSSQAKLNAHQGLAVLLIHDPETLQELNTDLLKDFYNLTRAESALAQLLFLGKSLPDTSDHLGISINTARTQLRSIFSKVGVHSQAALLQEFAKSIIEG